MLDALKTTHASGSLFIAWPKPNALRLQFYGLSRALRNEGKPELCDGIGFYTQSNPPGLWLRLKDTSDISTAIAAAIGENIPTASPSSPVAEAEALLSRLGFSENDSPL